MSRILLLIILFWLLFKLLKRLGENAAQTPSAKPNEKIVQCTQCGLRLPENESTLVDGKVVCHNSACSDAAQQ